MFQLPASIRRVIRAFAPLGTRPTWEHLQVLLTETRLCQGPRTVTAALRVMGLGQEKRFEHSHRVLNRARWSGLCGAQILLGQLIKRLPPSRAIIIAIDATLEWRKGERIAAKGVSREVVRSTERKVVTGLGWSWICMALLVPLSWGRRAWA